MLAGLVKADLGPQWVWKVMKRVQFLSDERLGQDRGIKESFIRCYRIDLS